MLIRPSQPPVFTQRRKPPVRRRSRWPVPSLLLATLVFCVLSGIFSNRIANVPLVSAGWQAITTHMLLPTATSVPTPIPAPGNQGIYVSCSPHIAGCRDDLGRLAHVGLRFVINYNQWDYGTTIDDLVAYANAAAALRLQVFWSFANTEFWNGTNLTARFPDMTASLQAQDHVSVGSGDIVRLVVQTLKNLPGTAGYYIGDEPGLANFQAIKSQVADVIHANDPNHPRLLVEGSSGPGYDGLLDAFAAIAEIMVQDYYPIGMGWSLDSTGAIAATLRQRHTGWGMVLQAHSLAQYPAIYTQCTPARCPFPSVAQMTKMRNAVLAQQPSLLIWYSEFDASDPHYNAGMQWNNLVAAIDAQ